MEEFDLDLVEALDYNKLSEQLKYIFKSEQDVVSFVNFLQNIKNFVNLSNDKRHMSLIDLGYFKSQITMFEKKIQSLIIKKKTTQTKEAIKRAKGIGEKITENVILYNTQEDKTLESLEQLNILVGGWASYMQDLYFMCGQTNKNLGNAFN